MESNAIMTNDLPSDLAADKSSANATDTFKYQAFISYRPADNKEPGRQWATWLHQAIESYQVPADLVGKINGRGEEIPARIYPIFRDEEELPANADLGNSIVSALNTSRILVVLCSPQAFASTYVADEIHYFKQIGRSDSIIAGLLYGEPNTSWDKGKLALGFTSEDECFPEPLQFEYDDKGKRTTRRAEPIAADFRINNGGIIEQGWTSPEAYRQHLEKDTSLTKSQRQLAIEKYQKQQHLMLLKIIAGILGVPLGQLSQRDKEYQLQQAQLKAKKLRRWLTLVALLAVVAIGAGFTAYYKQLEAIEQTKQAQISQSKTLAQNAIDAFARGEFQQSIEIARSALPRSLKTAERAYSQDAEAILASAVFHDRLLFSDKADTQWTDTDWLRKDPYKSQLSADKSRLVIYDGAAPVVINLNSFSRVQLQDMPLGLTWRSNVSHSGKYLSGSVTQNDSYQSYLWDTNSGSLITKLSAKDIRVSKSEHYIALNGNSKKQPNQLIELLTGNKTMEFIGNFRGLFAADTLLLSEGKRSCKWRDFKRVCLSPTYVYSVASGELIDTIQGKIAEQFSNDEQVIFDGAVEPSDSTEVVENNKPPKSTSRKPTGTLIWNTKHRKATNFYAGNLIHYNAKHKRVIIENRTTNIIELWDIDSDKAIAQIDGQIQARISDSHYEDLKRRKILWDDNTNYPFFISVIQRDEQQSSIKYSLLDGSILSETPGQFIGVTDNSRMLSHVIESGSHKVYAEFNQRAELEIPENFCSSQYSEQPVVERSRIKTSTVIVNCNDYIAVFFIESNDPSKPHIILSQHPAQWVDSGQFFYYGESTANLLTTSQWEGGHVQLEQMMKVKTRELTTFRSIDNGRFLLSLSPNSEINLWNSTGSIFKPVVTIDEMQVAADFIDNFEPADRDQQAAMIQKKVSSFTKLGFDMAKPFSPMPPLDNPKNRLLAKSIGNNITLKESFSPEGTYFEISDPNKVIVIDGDDSYLVDLLTAKVIAELYLSQPSEIYFEAFQEPVGVFESPTGDGFLYYNMHGMWLFSRSGKKLHTFCIDQSSCDFNTDFEWMDSGRSIFLKDRSPSIYSFMTNQFVSLCRSFDSISQCQQKLRGHALVGKNTIATGSIILDRHTGIKLLELPGGLGGMYSSPVSFNENETAVLMVAETGGGSLLYGAWQLPTRGEDLLKSLNSIENE